MGSGDGGYPIGIDGRGKPGGRVRILTDQNEDGRFDTSKVFLDNIPFPTGIMAWRSGVLVSAAPDIFYAEDQDRDGVCDYRVALYTGFAQGNQQHRINGFSCGLDNWVYCANGESGGVVKSTRTGKTVNLQSSDLRIRPDSGELEPQLGSTQFGRNRDDWDNWFGNSNTIPMWHYVLHDHYLRRNQHVVFPVGRVHLNAGQDANRCFPISSTPQRFNDLNMKGRFTSACSAIIYRDELFGEDFNGNFFVSEPVHNLVHREIVSPNGVSFSSHRAHDEQESEFLASRDTWFRPTMLKVGADGALYVADMYRAVIEHPQYIPREMQDGLNLRAGDDRGRIYRIFPTRHKPRAVARFDMMTPAVLVEALDSPSGWQRDTVQRMLIERGDVAAVPRLNEMVVASKRPQSRMQALCTLDGMDALTPLVVERALADSYPGVRRHAIRLAEKFFDDIPTIEHQIVALVRDPDLQVRMQLAYSLGEWTDPRAYRALVKLTADNVGDPYLQAAVESSVNMNNINW